MNNKKVLASAFALSMVLSLTACSSNSPQEEKKEDTKVVEKKKEKY